MKQFLFLFCLILIFSTCKEKVDLTVTSWQRISTFQKEVFDTKVEGNLIYFLAQTGFFAITEDGVIMDSIIVKNLDLSERARPQFIGENWVFPTISSNYSVVQQQLQFFSKSQPLMSLRRNDLYESNTYTGISTPVDLNSAPNGKINSLVFLSMNKDVSSYNYLAQYQIAKDQNSNWVYQEQNRFELPKKFGSNIFVAYKNGYFFSGHNETDFIDLQGNFTKLLDSEFKQIKATTDSIFGIQDYSVFWSRDGKTWTDSNISKFWRGQVEIVDGKLFNISGTWKGNWFPEVIDIRNSRTVKIDMSGIDFKYDSYLKGKYPPYTTAITKMGDNYYLFTSTGIYKKRADFLFRK